MLCRTQVYEGSGIRTRLSWSQVILKRLFREIYEFQTRSKAFSTYHFTHYFVKYNGTVLIRHIHSRLNPINDIYTYIYKTKDPRSVVMQHSLLSSYEQDQNVQQ